MTVQRTDRIVGELKASVKRLDWVGGRVGTEKNREAVDIFEKNLFPVSQEMENSYWLKGCKSVITLTMVDHVCFQAYFAAHSSCHH